MEQKENLEKDVDVSDLSSFTVLPPRREAKTEPEEEPISKASKNFSLSLVILSLRLAIVFIVLCFIYGRQNDGYSSDKGYGILPILLSSLCAIVFVASLYFLFAGKRNKNGFYKKLSVSFLYISGLLLNASYCFSIIRKDVIDKINRSGNNLFSQLYLVALILALVFGIGGIAVEFALKDGRKKSRIHSILFFLLSFLIFGFGSILRNPISYSPSGIALSVIGSFFLALGFILRQIRTKRNRTSLVLFVLILGRSVLLASFLSYGLLTPSALY